MIWNSSWKENYKEMKWFSTVISYCNYSYNFPFSHSFWFIKEPKRGNYENICISVGSKPSAWSKKLLSQTPCARDSRLMERKTVLTAPVSSDLQGDREVVFIEFFSMLYAIWMLIRHFKIWLFCTTLRSEYRLTFVIAHVSYWLQFRLKNTK